MSQISVLGERARESVAFGARTLGRPDRRYYAIAAVLLLSGVLHLGVQVVAGGPWTGPVSWRKPATFGLSFGLTLATLTWVTGYLPMAPRRRAGLLGVFALACVLEVLVITIQAWRRVPSHFNISTPVNAGFAYTAAFGGALIIVTSVLFAIASFRSGWTAPSMRLAVRAGFVTFVAALAIGAAMIAIGTVAARTDSQQAAYSAASALKNGHAATMHGILVLPGLAWLLSLTEWPESRRLLVVRSACAVYVLAAGVVAGLSIAALAGE